MFYCFVICINTFKSYINGTEYHLEGFMKQIQMKDLEKNRISRKTNWLLNSSYLQGSIIFSIPNSGNFYHIHAIFK